MRYVCKIILTKEAILRKKIVKLILVVLAAAALGAGCGSGSDSIDKAAFVEKANAVCKQANAKMRGQIAAITASKAGVKQEEIDLALMKEAVIPGMQAELDEIRALGIPSEKEKQARAFLAAQQQAIESAEANPTTFFSSEKTLEAVELAGTRYGIRECPIAEVTPE